MIAVLARRAALTIPTMLVVSFIMFLLLFIGPNPLEQLTDYSGYDSADVQRLTHLYGWDRPWHEQYVQWLGDFATGEWGESIRTKRPAREMILERLPLSLALASLSIMFSLLVAIPLGVLAAVRQRSRLDYSTTIATFALMAAPGFFLAVLLQLAAIKLKDGTGHTIFFTGGPMREGGIVEALRRYTLPVLTLSIVQIAGWMRYQRSELLAVLGQDYIRFARAKGLSGRTVLLRHALRNTALPMLTLLALDAGHVLGGAVITETVYGLPGVGRLLIDSVQARDTIVALDIVMLGALAMIVANALADTLYGVFDPRVRDG